MGHLSEQDRMNMLNDIYKEVDQEWIAHHLSATNRRMGNTTIYHASS